MAATMLPIPDLAPEPGEADGPADRAGDHDALERTDRHEVAFALFDDDGVMIRVLLEEDDESE